MSEITQVVSIELIFYCSFAIIFSFICSILESVFLSTTHSFVESYEKTHKKVGGYLRHLKNNVEDAEGAILVLNTFAVTACSTGFGIEVAKLYGAEWQFFASIIFAIALIYITEIFPKTLGATYWKALAPSMAVCVHYLLFITYPLVLVAKLLMRLISPTHKDSISREEILAAGEIGKDGGSLHGKEKRLMENVLMLKNIEVEEILTPRTVVFGLKYSDKIKDVASQKGLMNYSCALVYGENTDSVQGIVATQDILALMVEGKGEVQISEITKSVYAVPYNLSALKVLNLFLIRKERFFIVLDRFEQFLGIVTYEDSIESLLGEEIVDEFDEVADMQAVVKLKGSKKQ